MKQQTTNSALFLVPTMLHAITKINHDHLHLTTILSSGAKLSSSLFKRIAETFRHANIIEFLERQKQVLLVITLTVKLLLIQWDTYFKM